MTVSIQAAPSGIFCGRCVRSYRAQHFPCCFPVPVLQPTGTRYHFIPHYIHLPVKAYCSSIQSGFTMLCECFDTAFDLLQPQFVFYLDLAL